ncbi:hypothetical protein SAMN05414139_05654 [Burkholderia sp. D7]|jgi:hypothetical protein|nr:hypothetical protein SAMN05414139_05654 [Burkholderia sp. D7]
MLAVSPCGERDIFVSRRALESAVKCPVVADLGLTTCTDTREIQQPPSRVSLFQSAVLRRLIELDDVPTSEAPQATAVGI